MAARLPVPEGVVETVIEKGRETSHQWFDTSSGKWVWKSFRMNTKGSCVYYSPPEDPAKKAFSFISNPAPWERARREEAGETMDDAFGQWKDGEEMVSNEDWGKIHVQLPIHRWIVKAMCAEARGKKSVSRDLKETMSILVAELYDANETELSTKVTEYLNRSGWAQKGGFRPEENYGRKGAGRGDSEQTKRWRDHLIKKSEKNVDTGTDYYTFCRESYIWLIIQRSQDFRYCWTENA